MTTPELLDPRHTTYSHTAPEVCACGAPQHDGSVWIKPVPAPPEPAQEG